MNVHFKSTNQNYSTPDKVFNVLDLEFGFTLDVCATEETKKCDKYFSLDNSECGLLNDWGENVCWMNPPYGKALPLWMEKAYRESGRRATVVCLIPSRTDTRWWHDYAMKGEVRFIKGRLKFGEAKHNAPFPSAIIIFRNNG